jgi:luciferase family oxidoreductase group 1
MVAPLSILDLVPVTSGSTAGAALRNTIDLAQHAEAAGYRRYWIAEHHLNPGVAGTSPALVSSIVAGATKTIRVGSGAVQMGHHTPLSVVEQFGLVDALHPGRIDLGLGRSAFRAPPATNGGPAADPLAGRGSSTAFRTAGGLLIPARVQLARPELRTKLQLHADLLQQPEARTPHYADQVDQVLALLEGTYLAPDGSAVQVVPGQGAPLEVWILGSSRGTSADVAGARSLPFAANYHVSPSSVLEAVDGYREAFRPSDTADRPRVMVSADVVVADDDATARELASPYGLWVRSIRKGIGAIAFPSPREAAGHRWTDEDRALVADRVDTQLVGSPAAVADQLELLAFETGADELMVTTITHDHADRVRSFQLLAEEWARREATRGHRSEPQAALTARPGAGG